MVTKRRQLNLTYSGTSTSFTLLETAELLADRPATAIAREILDAHLPQYVNEMLRRRQQMEETKRRVDEGLEALRRDSQTEAAPLAVLTDDRPRLDRPRYRGESDLAPGYDEVVAMRVHVMPKAIQLSSGTPIKTVPNLPRYRPISPVVSDDDAELD